MLSLTKAAILSGGWNRCRALRVGLCVQTSVGCRSKLLEMTNRSIYLVAWLVFGAFGLVGSATPSVAADLVLKVARDAGATNGEPLVLPDCANSNLRIAPCQPVARSWLEHLNSRAEAFVKAYHAAGHDDDVTSVVLDCSKGIYSNRMTRRGMRKSRHAYSEACDGNYIQVNDNRFRYRRAVTDKLSTDRLFFVKFLDAWGTPGPGCVPERGYKVFGIEIGCRPILADNCGVIDWRERGARGQYGRTYHLSYCHYGDAQRAYE